MRVTVYDWFGSDRVEVDLESGDVVQYKRNGRTGFVIAIFRGEEAGRAVLQFPDGAAVRLSPARSIVAAFRKGDRLGRPEDPVRTVTIEEVEAPSENWIGHIRARDARGRECYWNGHCAGWPSDLPAIGEVWTVEVRLEKFDEFVQHGTWHFVTRVAR